MKNPAQLAHDNHTRHKVKNGFSLVELSIVLVILGLLVGSVLSGQSLVHASQLRSITSEHDKFLTAVGAFQGKYLALPGDMTNATEFWGATNASHKDCGFVFDDEGGSVPTIPVGASSGSKTCDGNGDKHVDYAALYKIGVLGQDEPTDISLNMEAAVFWQQLSNAGLISGTYNGSYGEIVNSGDPNNPMAGPTDGSSSSPSGKIPQAVWGTKYSDISGNSLYYSKSSQLNDFDLLAGEDVWNIDKKMDDGVPTTGKVHPAAVDASNIPCINGASYNLTSTVKNCGIEFSNQF